MNETVIVNVREGKLRGIKKESKFSGSKFYSFYGVPYGEAPEKNLRFKDPVKVKPWKSIRDATKEINKGCTQFFLLSGAIIGSEDCLYMNIHTPQLPSEGVPSKPVIVLIHSGSFRFGSPETWHFGSPEFIMHHDVVYVCIAFRLHILGFLNLNMKECSGNQGLKDIILGLKWMKENIRKFNGDPDNITLYGTSSGGTKINLLMMSPAVEGLFHKAVMTSPSCTSTVYFGLKDENETAAFRLGGILGFKGGDRKSLLKFFKKLPAEVLVASQRECEKELQQCTAPVFPHSIFLPTIDAVSDIPVIPISPRQLINSMTPRPFILGICERESVLAFATPRVQTLTEENYSTAYRQNQWSWMYDLSDDEMETLHKQVERFYLKDCSFKDAPLSDKVDMLSEIGLHDIYDNPINPMAEKLPSSVYLYKYQYDSDMSSLKTIMLIHQKRLTGSYHSCDLSCWHYFGQDLTEENVRVINMYTKLVTNFAKNGDPNYEELGVHWKPTTVEQPCYLCINTKPQMIDGQFHQNSAEFWKNIKKQFKKS